MRRIDFPDRNITKLLSRDYYWHKEMYVERYVDRCTSRSANATKPGVIMIVPCISYYIIIPRYYIIIPALTLARRAELVLVRLDGKRVRERDR